MGNTEETFNQLLLMWGYRDGEPTYRLVAKINSNRAIYSHAVETVGLDAMGDTFWHTNFTLSLAIDALARDIVEGTILAGMPGEVMLMLERKEKGDE